MSPAPPPAPWMTAKNLAYVAAAWGNVSARYIARVVGTTKSAVIGKAGRMGLRRLPSPIIRDPSRPPRPRVLKPAPAPQAVQPVRRDAMRPAFTAPARAAPPPVPRRNDDPCCWPLGEPGTRAFRYCDDATVPGRPYCGEHAALAYVPTRRRDDAGDGAGSVATMGAA